MAKVYDQNFEDWLMMKPPSRRSRFKIWKACRRSRPNLGGSDKIKRLLLGNLASPKKEKKLAVAPLVTMEVGHRR